jgi:hypothetical protein
MEIVKRKIENKLSKHYILVTGCQRSGTTMTFLIIENHSRVKGLDEKELGEKKHPPLKKLLFNKLLGYRTCRKLPTQSADKNNIKHYYKNANIVWLIRNPLDTVQSMKKLSYENWNGNWIQEASHIEVNNLKRMFPNAKGLVDIGSETEIGAKIWKLNHMAMEEFKKSGLNVIKVKYENILRNTKNELKKVFKHINLDYESETTKYYTEDRNKKRSLSGETDADKKINKKNVDKEIKLTKMEIEKIKRVCGSRAKKEGYEIK